VSAVVRAAVPGDEGAIFGFIRGLAEYEKLQFQLTGTEQELREHLFGERPCVEAAVALIDGEIVGYALWFQTYSTFRTKPGIWMEDLFVDPVWRSKGIGKQLLQYVLDIGEARGCARVEWSVLDWNEHAIKFYESIGAHILPAWRICRIERV